jgi:hypothetical protein
MTNDLSSPTSRRATIDAFLEKRRLQRQAPGTRGRLVFALDATESRQPTWELACRLQAEMFRTAIGALDIQFVYFCGSCEFQVSPWISNGQALAELMTNVECRAGFTQIGRVLTHAHKENNRQKVAALAYVGDCVEEEPAALYDIARQLNLPVFMFQEGDDPIATKVFARIAALTKGAHCRFDAGAADQLAELLRAVAAYAAGGLEALRLSSNAGAVKLLQQLK